MLEQLLDYNKLSGLLVKENASFNSDFGSPVENFEFSFPNEIIDFSTPKHALQHNSQLVEEKRPDQVPHRFEGSVHPTVSLPPVASIVISGTTREPKKPREPIISSSGQRHPPAPAITKLQAFAVPGSQKDNQGFKVAGSQDNQGFKVPGSQDNQHILTNRPMTFQTASGEFKPPSTLLYGFKPMTTPLPPPSNHPASHSSPSSPASLDVRLQRGELQGRRKGRKTPSMLQRISNFLEPITRPITRLMAGL